MKREFTPEEAADIRAAYREAANKEKRIHILADLHDVPEVEIYRVLGLPVPASASKRRLRSYDQAVKQDVIKAVLLEGLTQVEAAEKFGVPKTNVCIWVKKAREKQAEFLEYPEGCSGEKAECKEQPEDKNVKAKWDDPYALRERIARELAAGVEGLQTFEHNFAGVDIFELDEWELLDRILERAKGFLAGFESGAQLEGEK